MTCAAHCRVQQQAQPPLERLVQGTLVEKTLLLTCQHFIDKFVQAALIALSCIVTHEAWQEHVYAASLKVPPEWVLVVNHLGL